MTMGTAARRIRSSVATIGLAHTLHDLALREANRTLLIKILKGMAVERVNAAFLICPEPYRPMFLDEERLRGFCRDPGNDMPESFLEEALSNAERRGSIRRASCCTPATDTYICTKGSPTSATAGGAFMRSA